METSIREGFQARIMGKPKTDNPNLYGSGAWQRWRDGWEDADRHEHDKAEALASIGWFG